MTEHTSPKKGSIQRLGWLKIAAVFGVIAVLCGGAIALYGFGRALWAFFFEGI